ncbi:hypothetical protein GCM10011354_00580 [Egicoccus halophilus]|uniref:Uncharacterized protein n=1 Tax=Egicoccus halophilus TaxID=1670830 RepID=A0A8J3AA76_9ACTN|nr:hypothetical protein GCM10011354_00580 [Egicoccus halophilus]
MRCSSSTPQRVHGWMFPSYPCSGWSELLLALPEFVLTDAHIDGDDELFAHVELPRDAYGLGSSVG